MFPLFTKYSCFVMPQNCSGSLNSAIRRCDNKLSFARQASSEQGFFMKQASPDEVPQLPSYLVIIISLGGVIMSVK